MNDYISTKTVFINKLYEKFHKKNIANKLINFNKKKYNEFLEGNLCMSFVFKYKYYIFEAPQEIAEDVFFGCLNFRRPTKELFLKNFEIKGYEDNESLEFKKNTSDTVYINKYQTLFFYFWIKSLILFKKADQKVDVLINNLLKN